MLNIFKIIKNLRYAPKAYKAAHAIEAAWDLVAQNNPNDAEKKFEEGEALLSDLLESLPIQYKIIKAVIKFRLRKRDEALSIYQDAWKDIDKDTTMAYEDKLYLKWYIYDAMRIYEQHLKSSLNNIHPISPSDVRLATVSLDLKRRFPLNTHPDWHKFGA